MKKAAIPDNEISRLKALYQYDVLDTDAEQVFDDLTELASEICGTPIALISLIDQDRQWFKSKVGLSASETHRDIAFCAHAIHHDDIFAVSDTLLDERFRDNPLVTEDPSIRSYFGAPLITPEGYAIGTLCAISDKPNELNSHQLKALEILGRQVIAQLQLRLKVKEVELANKRKTDFLSNLSHELRTPLNAIISFSQLMLFDKGFELPKKHRQYLKHLDYSGKRLLDLVNSVLDLNKIDSGKLVLEEDHLDTQDYLESISSLITALAKSKSINIDFKIETNDVEYFIADETRLSQIILNLASNAIKFSKDAQSVAIHISFVG
jgi:GAF domain-containing protein